MPYIVPYTPSQCHIWKGSKYARRSLSSLHRSFMFGKNYRPVKRAEIFHEAETKRAGRRAKYTYNRVQKLLQEKR